MHLLELVRGCRDSRRLVLLIVAVALLLDNMLLTTVGKRPYRFFILTGQPIDRPPCAGPGGPAPHAHSSRSSRSAHHSKLPLRAEQGV